MTDSRQKSGSATTPSQTSVPSSPGTAAAISRPSEGRFVLSGITGSAKRKAEDSDGGPPAKLGRTEGVNLPPNIAALIPGRAALGKSVTADMGTLGISKAPSTRFQPSPNGAKPVLGPTARSPASVAPSSTKPTAPAAKPALKGYAAILAKAKASEEALKAAGNTTIVHKPIEKVTKRERDRLKVEAAEKQKTGGIGKRKALPTAQGERSRSDTPGHGRSGEQTKQGPSQIAYQGTMRKGPAPLAYKGTMRAAAPNQPAKASKPKDRYGGQEKYGGYASWDDIDDAEDEDEQDYDSESDMEARVDEIDEEEELAARVAKKEDQEALAEEARLKKEKLARKQKLMALSKNAREKKKY